ncbi:hypothetical protein MMC25_003759 [Agyrium rufum]|nr:hypothetical protein [Agyrium rufum]
MAYDLPDNLREIDLGATDVVVNAIYDDLERSVGVWRKTEKFNKNSREEQRSRDSTWRSSDNTQTAQHIHAQRPRHPAHGVNSSTRSIPINVPGHHKYDETGQEDEEEDEEGEEDQANSFRAADLHNERYHEPSPLETYLKQRRSSITFSPEVTLDSGHHIPLEQPIPKSSDRSLLQELADRPQKAPLNRAHTFAAYTSFDPSTGEVLERPTRSADNEASDGVCSNNIRHHPNLPPIKTAISDTALPSLSSDDPSLTSHTTLSPPASAVSTPATSSTTNNGYFPSPQSAYSPFSKPSKSLDSPASWPSKRQIKPQSIRAKSYTIERSNSLRSSRRSSTNRRSASNSLASPATAFLSKWSSRNAEDHFPLPDDEGQEVGEYVLGKEIGWGGFSVVREAHTLMPALSSQSDRPPPRQEPRQSSLRHAVKIVRKHVPRKDELENERLQADFDHEVGLWRCLNHENIMPLIAVHITPFATFCFTKLNTGGTLHDLVKSNRKGLGERRTRAYSVQLASAMRYLHEDVRIAHRDIKLENCLIDFGDDDSIDNVKSRGSSDRIGHLLLCDFGLAQFITGDTRPSSPGPSPFSAAMFRERTLTAATPGPKTPSMPMPTATTLAGSLHYASPELLLLDESSNIAECNLTATDAWAFGCTVYALATGDLPFWHSFAPRVRELVLAGNWSRDLIRERLLHSSQSAGSDYSLNGVGGGASLIELLEGCLAPDVERRWDAGKILSCRWFCKS